MVSGYGCRQYHAQQPVNGGSWRTVALLPLHQLPRLTRGCSCHCPTLPGQVAFSTSMNQRQVCRQVSKGRMEGIFDFLETKEGFSKCFTYFLPHPIPSEREAKLES